MRPLLLIFLSCLTIHANEGEGIFYKAVTEYDRGHYTEAERLHIEALALLEARYPDGHPSIATSLHNLAVLARMRGDLNLAEKYFDRVLALRVGRPESRNEYAATLVEVANLWHTRKNPYKAEPLLREAIAILETPPRGDKENDIALSAAYNTLGTLHLGLQDYEGGERQLRKAIAYAGEAPPAHRVTLNSNLAASLCAQGRNEECFTLFQRTVEIAQRELGPDHPRYQDVVGYYAKALKRARRGDEAKALLLQQRSVPINTLR